MTLMPSLDVTRLRHTLGPDPFWADVRVLESTGSTNADLVALSEAGAAEGTVLATNDQTAGRGRLTRTWVSPRGSGIAVSVLLRPDGISREKWSWLPLLAGIAVVDALDDTGVTARLKWPNDVLVRERKIAGILVEIADHGAAAVIGIGVNLTPSAADLATQHATSVGIELGLPVDPTPALATLLRSLGGWYRLWRNAPHATDAGGVVATAYAERSATLGRDVEITLPGDSVRTGTASAIDANGGLVVATPDGPMTFAAGDVVHLR